MTDQTLSIFFFLSSSLILILVLRQILKKWNDEDIHHLLAITHSFLLFVICAYLIVLVFATIVLFYLDSGQIPFFIENHTVLETLQQQGLFILLLKYWSPCLALIIFDFCILSLLIKISKKLIPETT